MGTQVKPVRNSQSHRLERNIASLVERYLEIDSIQELSQMDENEEAAEMANMVSDIMAVIKTDADQRYRNGMLLYPHMHCCGDAKNCIPDPPVNKYIYAEGGGGLDK